MPTRTNADPLRVRPSRRKALPLTVAAISVLAGLVLAVPELLTRPGTVAPAAAEPGTTQTPTSAPGSEAAPSFARDELGYLDSSARCDDDQGLVAYGRTSRALVAVCVDPTGELEYRGVRLSDQASLTMPAGWAADGSIVAGNDGVTYAVSPEALLVSEGDAVLYRDSWAEFGQPRFDGDPTASTTTQSRPATTVSTTTVTMTSPPAGR